MTKVEHCIYVAPPTKYRPQGYKVIKMVTSMGIDEKYLRSFADVTPLTGQGATGTRSTPQSESGDTTQTPSRRSTRPK